MVADDDDDGRRLVEVDSEAVHRGDRGGHEVDTVSNAWGLYKLRRSDRGPR